MKGQELSKLRRLLFISVPELAQEINVNERTIRRWEEEKKGYRDGGVMPDDVVKTIKKLLALREKLIKNKSCIYKGYFDDKVFERVVEFRTHQSASAHVLSQELNKS